MKQITRVITILLLSSVLTTFITPFGFAQQLSPEERGCIVKQFKEYAYAPFRIVQTGDPATRNSIEDVHGDPQSRWHLDRAEFEDSDAPTILNFFTNSVDDWKFTVRTSYQTEAIEPRPIIVSYQSDNREFFSETFYRTGFDFCIIYYVAVREPPHIFTEEEILATADKIQKENFQVVASTISLLIKEVTATKNSNNVVNAMSVVLILALLITNALQNRGNKTLKKAMKSERQLLSGERARTELQTKQNKIDNAQNRKENREKLDGLVNIFEIALNSLKIEYGIPIKIKRITNHCPFCKVDYITEKDITDHIESAHKDEIAQLEDNNEYITQFEPTGKKDPLKLDEAKEKPKYFGLVGKVDEAKTKLTEVISGSKTIEKPVGEKTETYYMKYYYDKLKGHSELITEFEKQNKEYSETEKRDCYFRALALSNLSANDKKFDPRNEVED